jgi:hypothetical protein
MKEERVIDGAVPARMGRTKGAGTRIDPIVAAPDRRPIVIPAKAGISARAVSAGLPEVPAFAGMTSGHRRRPRLDPGCSVDPGMWRPVSRHVNLREQGLGRRAAASSRRPGIDKAPALRLGPRWLRGQD